MAAMRSTDYRSNGPAVNGNDTGSPNQDSTSINPLSEPLQIEKPNSDMVIWLPPKGVLQNLAFNHHARVV